MMRTILSTILVIVVALGLSGCGDPRERALERRHLYVEDLQVGDGETVAAGDYVRVDFTGRLYADGEPGRTVDATDLEPRGFVLGAGEVMPGWDEGLVGMRGGGSRRLIVGPDQITGPFRPRGVAADEYLQYEFTLRSAARIGVRELAPGEGAALAAGDFVLVRYDGWIDQTGVRGEPVITSGPDGRPVGVLLGAGMLSRGLELGLEGSRVGSRREITVPRELAFSRRGRGPAAPDTNLVYEIEVVAKPEIRHEVLREGTGEPVGVGRRIQIHLAGWIRQPDGSKGEEFQDTRKLGQPAAIFLGEFKIQPGLELGIRGMRAGELRRLEVPAPLAFGAQGWIRGDRVIVPPDADVIYEVEVVSPSQ